jgi:hypothetical protein
VAVCLPFFGGRLLLLDWAGGPHTPLVPPSAFGLNGGAALSGGILIEIIANASWHYLGGPGTWILLFLFFPIATTTIARLVGGPLVARLGAGVLYTVNPFVFDRVYGGQIPLLLGYALLPACVASLLKAARSGSPWRAGLWCAALVALSPHFAFILAPIAVAVAVSWQNRTRSIATVAAVAALAALANLYIFVMASAAGVRPTNLADQLAAYRTNGDPKVGLFVNVAGLYGFFHGEATEAKNLFSGWPAILLAILIVAGYGYYQALRDPERRRLAACVLAGGVAGYVGALGDQGPVGAIYRSAYLHVPGFEIMREPQKFAILLALAYACGFAWGLEGLLLASRSRRGVVLTWIAAAALPIAYVPNMAWGLGGQVLASSYPASWQSAARVVDRGGGGTVAFFPWHLYMPMPFAQGRLVANPSPGFFAGPVMAGDNPGVGASFSSPDTEAAFVADFANYGKATRHAGALLAPLGVKWVILARVDDWRNYTWLLSQRDLRLAYVDPDIWVLENEAPTVGAYRVDKLSSVSNDVALIKAAAARIPGPAAVLQSTARSRGILTTSAPQEVEPARVRATSTVSYSVPAGRPSWVELPAPYQSGWTLAGKEPVPLADGTMAFPAGAAASTASFAPWTSVLLGDLGSIVVVILLIALSITAARSTRREQT